MTPAELHDTVLEAGSVRSRLAKVYAEALLATALKSGAADDVGAELTSFVREVLDSNPALGAFFTSPVVGKKRKTAALEAALPGRTSGLLRGFILVLTRNNRLDLLRGVEAAYRRLLDDRAGRVQVKVRTAAELTDDQRADLTKTLAGILKQEPVLAIRIDPDLLGGLVVQVGDRVIDTSVRTRLQTLRTLLLDKGSSYVVQ